VPRRNYDRTIVVHLTAQALIVDYRLELDEFTAVFIDLPAVLSKPDLDKLTTPLQVYEAFGRAHAARIADGLTARLDRAPPLPLQCIHKQPRTTDEQGKPLDHLRFDFQFQVPWQPSPDTVHELTLQETNYELEEGVISLTLDGESPVEIVTKSEPDPPLRLSLTRNLKPGDDAKRRQAMARFRLSRVPPSDTAVAEPARSAAEAARPLRLLDLLMDPGRGLWLLLVLAAGLGSIHALTPGHGKTLVAAYLIGERGTVWHAVALGLVTTATHTGTVIALAIGLLYFYPDTVPADVKMVLGLIGGVLIAGLGFWLLLRRLRGQADHFHLGGLGHHHHHNHSHGHDPTDHWHDELGHSHPAQEKPGVWGLVALGIQGGIIPCWDAIAMLGFGISAQRVWLALVLLLAFSFGLAGVLVATGILVVRLKGFAASHWEHHWIIRSLPLISAFLVTLLGLWLCYESLRATD
jgi:ABC-type nickel/cobalt efflux system permease component RcnA